MKTIHIYTDGACKGNPGRGGWGAILKHDGHIKELKGFAPHTTNNRMELMGPIEALTHLREPCSVVLTSDSQYLSKGMTEWLVGWKAKGWRTASKKSVLNQDLWEQLDTLNQIHKIEWRWVKGHAGHIENERCDCLANQAIEEAQN